MNGRLDIASEYALCILFVVAFFVMVCSPLIAIWNLLLSVKVFAASFVAAVVLLAVEA